MKKISNENGSLPIGEIEGKMHYLVMFEREVCVCLMSDRKKDGITNPVWNYLSSHMSIESALKYYSQKFLSYSESWSELFEKLEQLNKKIDSILKSR
jgi:hypothetical protein